MRIDRLELRNFKKFDTFDISLHPHFTLLIGGNGSGKTSVLDALAVGLGVWFVKPPDSMLFLRHRRFSRADIRLTPVKLGDRIQFREAEGDTSVKSTGLIDGQTLSWERTLDRYFSKAQSLFGVKSLRVSYSGTDALAVVARAYARAIAEEKVLMPVLAYYGAGRAWLTDFPRREPASVVNGPVRRWDAFRDCLNGRIRVADLNEWFLRESLAAVNRGGKFRPGFEVVRTAILRCVPGADAIWFDADWGQIVLSLDGHAQPFSNLSAGQRTMLAVTADIAIKAVTQNNYLVPDDGSGPAHGELPEVLKQTPGVVLIDELDVHLHPNWQRRVAADLKRTFPQIQFVCTSHSPQIIGELNPEEIRHLDESTAGRMPAQSYGLDSNAILEDVLGAESRTQPVTEAIEAVEQSLEEGELDVARQKLEELEKLQHGPTRDSARLEATINNLEVLADEDD